MYIFIGFVVLVSCIYFFLITGRKPQQDNVRWMVRRSFAHRGLFKKDQSIPENSMPAFEKAVQSGYGIELDVALTRDDMVAVFHDDSLKRMTGLDKNINQVTYDELKELSLAGTEYNAPLFEDVLKLVDGKAPLIIELKNGKKNNLLCSKVLDMLKDYKGDFCIESFNPFIVGWFKKNAPDIVRGQLSMKYKGETTLGLAAHFILENMFLNCVGRPNFIAYKHTDCNKLCFKINRYLKVITAAWTIDSQEEMDKALKEYDVVIFQHFIPERKF